MYSAPTTGRCQASWKTKLNDGCESRIAVEVILAAIPDRQEPFVPKIHMCPRESRTYKSNGGEEEDRTPDLCIANAALSQLSYPPTDFP